MNHLLVVDLDGTLIKSDTLHDSIGTIIRKSPLSILQFPYRLLHGKASFKSWLSSFAFPDPRFLPYNKDVLEIIEKHKAEGGKVALATAAHYRIAKSVSDHLGIFDYVLSSDEITNLKSKEKLKAIQKICTTFSYLGDSKADLEILRNSRDCYVIGNKIKLKDQNNVTYISCSQNRFQSILKLIRPHQWTKNALIFLPMIGAHDFSAFGQSLIGAICFSFFASAFYIVNDFVDIENDRAHLSKFKRPLAAGDVSIQVAAFVFLLLILTASTIAFSYLGTSFFNVLMLYGLLTFFYSFYLKALAIVDVFSLTALYIIRVMAGHAATGLEYSTWLISFCMFLFLSLALIKRVSELNTLKLAGKQEIKGRGYNVEDLSMLVPLGVSSAAMTVLVFAIYINAPEVASRYQYPQAMWFIVPMLMLWLSRVWFLTGRSLIHEDPIVFAIKDKFTWFCLILIFSILVWAVNSI